VLDVAGFAPCFLVGGVAENFGTSFRLTASKYFVIEADEYDTAYFDKGPKMWHYLPDTAIVNNVEFDHADIYRDEAAYHWAFARFINLIPSRGTLVAGFDSPVVRALAAKSFAPVESFGYAGAESPAATLPAPRWTAADVSFRADRTAFTVLHDGRVWGAVETPLAGAFNVRNVLAAIAAAEAVGAERDRVREALRTFRSVRRRMEVRGVVADITVIDDFAHHPTAVRETVAATRQRYPGQRLVAVFEPRSYTAQRREFQTEYEQALGLADEVVIAGLFHPERYTADSAIDPHAMVALWREAGRTAAHIIDPVEIARTLAASARPGDVVLIMSNGGFGGVHEKLLLALRARFDTATPA
jgi:UDP-N-acetylmuramate: L-alanyl-gamma-D-glutamyl-meso-diaminopimelate ligase